MHVPDSVVHFVAVFDFPKPFIRNIASSTRTSNPRAAMIMVFIDNSTPFALFLNILKNLQHNPFKIFAKEKNN